MSIYQKVIGRPMSHRAGQNHFWRIHGGPIINRILVHGVLPVMYTQACTKGLY
jgi:hypothetical protein